MAQFKAGDRRRSFHKMVRETGMYCPICLCSLVWMDKEKNMMICERCLKECSYFKALDFDQMVHEKFVRRKPRTL